jgi:hypothetical protein
MNSAGQSPPLNTSVFGGGATNLATTTPTPRNTSIFGSSGTPTGPWMASQTNRANNGGSIFGNGPNFDAGSSNIFGNTASSGNNSSTSGPNGAPTNVTTLFGANRTDVWSTPVRTLTAVGGNLPPNAYSYDSFARAAAPSAYSSSYATARNPTSRARPSRRRYEDNNFVPLFGG